MKTQTQALIAGTAAMTSARYFLNTPWRPALIVGAAATILFLVLTEFSDTPA